MRNLLSALIAFMIALSADAQFIATMEVKEDIPGICDKNAVYALFKGFKGQVEPVCAVSNEEILKILNEEVSFLKSNPKHKDKGMMGIIINCKGEVVQCRISNKTQSPELDEQIKKVFCSLTSWKPGTLDGKEVDASELFSYKIKNGKITFD